MPSHLMLRCTWKLKDDDPKNQIVITPKFRHQFNWLTLDGSADIQTLCDDLASALNTWCAQTNKEINVKAYDLEGTPPNYPKASKTLNTGVPLTARFPGQLACCLSFYSGQNIPRKRGRLYLPCNVLSNTPSDFTSDVIPTAQMSKAGLLPAIFAGLGGTNVDWIVWSEVAQSAAKVSNWFIDESVDIQRSRKLKAVATRATGTTGG